MESAQQKAITFDGASGKGAAELNHGTGYEHKEVRNRVAGDGQGLSEEVESRINVAAMGVKESHALVASVIAHNPVLEKQQLQPTVRWERFLPLRTLKVLLVENDDSTRQIVSALLRNCCYEVTAVANALEAWRLLEDLTNHIDLVLTEVIMPCFSGVGLLCKIMSHKTCKTIPVIMMSSNDSMGIVFKCLSKGAVDFLVKPIRKNELKNLWQHVWRRCHSSCGSGSGSGSESGIQGQKRTNSKSEDDSDNNTDSNEEGDNGSIGWNARDGSDNGSGTQNSWTKRANEVDSLQSLPTSKQLSSPHDSTCAQVILPRPDTFCSKKMAVNSCMDLNKQKKIAANDDMGKDLGIEGALRNKDRRDESYQDDKVSIDLTVPSMNKSPEFRRSVVDVVRHTSFNVLHEPSIQVAEELGGISDNNTQQFMLSTSDTTPKDSSKISENKDKAYMDLPAFELSLKRLRSAREVGIASSDEKKVLKRSNLSAFSRYPTSVASAQAPTGCGGSSLLDNSSEVAPLNQGSNGSSDNNDMGSTNKNCVTKTGIYKEASTPATKCNHPSSAFHHVQPKNSTIQPVMHEKIDEAATAPVIGQSRGSQKQVQVQHHHHHYHHHHHHHVHALPSQPDQEDSSLENLKEAVAFCSASNAVSRPVEANASNYSLNGSNSSSKHGSDGQIECNAAINMGETNMESDSCLAEKDGIGGGNGSGCGSGTVDQNRSAQREAALNKFRQKRKARNFTKKVRYQSRKTLAEQRPRFHGQFVRRIVRNENHLADDTLYD